MNRSLVRLLSRYMPILIIVMCCSGCGAMRANTVGPKVSYPSPQAAWDAIHRNAMANRTLKAIARISLLQDDRLQYYFKGAVMVKKPKYLRFEALPLIGPPDFFLTINNENMKVFLPDRAEFYVGAASKENLMAFLPLSLSPEDVVALLMGTYPHAIPPTPPILRGDPQDDVYRLDLLNGRHVMISCRIDPAHHRLIGYEAFDASGNLQYRVTFGDFFQEQGISVPMEIRLTAGSRDVKEVVIKLADIQVVREDDPAPYDLAMPSGAQIVPLKSR